MCEYFCIQFINFMLNGKSLKEYTNLFSPNDLKKNEDIVCLILKMNNYIDVISKINLSDQTKIRLCEIIRIENYFYYEINERKSYIKNLNKYIPIFEYVDKNVNYLNCNKRRSIDYFIYYYCWCYSWNYMCNLYFKFFYSKRIDKNIIKNNKKLKEKVW